MNRPHSILLALLSFPILSLLFAQEGIQLNDEKAFNKYLLFNSAGNSYLVDNCGLKVYEWDDIGFPRYHTKLAKNGDLLYLGTNNIYRADKNGIAASIYQNTDYDFNFDYEVIEMDNGNYLCIGRRFFYSELKDELAYNLHSSMYDVIVEIDIILQRVVWEWRSIDHTVQDHDNSKSNFGNIKDHPELLDFQALSNFDWDSETFMINGMDYNKEADQIVVSLRKMGEVAIIDHSTTTHEASGHTGGNANKGGDMLYRWGNPSNYKQGDITDKLLYFQHNPNWIKYGPHKNKIIIFNNRLTAEYSNQGFPYSSVEIIDPPIDSSNNYFRDSTGRYGPLAADWTYVDTTSIAHMFSAYTSAAQVLPNANVLISVGASRDVYEVTLEKELVWHYTLPSNSFLFRTEPYPLNFPGLVDHDLIPDGTVESPSSTYDCMLYTSIQNQIDLQAHALTINVSQDLIEFISASTNEMTLRLTSMNGKEILSQKFYSNQAFISTDQIDNGCYVASVVTKHGAFSRIIVIVK